MTNPYFDLKTTLLGSLAAGLISAYLAHRRGKNPMLWFCVGVLFGFFGVFALFFFMGPKRKKGPTPQPVLPEPYLIGPSNKFWYYLDATHKQIGPLSYQGVTHLWKQGKIPLSTFLWHEDLVDWKPLQELIQEPTTGP